MALYTLLENIASCACLAWLGLNDIFDWYAESCVFNRSLVSVETEAFMQFTVIIKKVSPEKSLNSDFSPCGISFIEMRQNRNANSDPCSTSALIDRQLED